METTAAYITFIHVFIVFILVAQHCCRGIKMLFTNVTLDRRMRYAEMLVQFFLCREDGVAPCTGESSWLHIFSFKFVFYRFKNLFWDWGVVTLPVGCSIFIAVPMTRGSMGGLMSVSNRPSTLGTTCGCCCNCGAIGRVVSSS